MMSATKCSTKCEYSHGETGGFGPCPRSPTAVMRECLAPVSTALTPGASPCSYGTNFSWTDIPRCMNISECSCDLTYYTLDPARRYYARVRAVSGNHTSPWQRTNSFSPQEGRSGVCLHPAARGFEDGRGQGVKLLGKNLGTDESRDVSLYLPAGRLRWDGTSLGQVAPAARDSHSSVHCCKQEKILMCSSNRLVSSQPAPVRPEPLCVGQHRPRGAAAAPQGGEPHCAIRGHSEARKALPGLRQEGTGQSNGEMSCWSHAVPIRHTQHCPS